MCIPACNGQGVCIPSCTGQGCVSAWEVSAQGVYPEGCLPGVSAGRVSALEVATPQRPEADIPLADTTGYGQQAGGNAFLFCDVFVSSFILG